LNKTPLPEPFFIADHRALDFLNSICAPWKDEIEWIGNSDGLFDWLNKAGLLTTEISTHYKKEYSTEILDSIATQTRDLREYFREFILSHAGHTLDGSALTALDRLNQLLARDHQYQQIRLDQNGFSIQLQQERHWEKAEDLLLPIANAMANLICTTDFTQIKNCEGPTCSLWFLDISKNHKRRWCTMSVCGNRAKAATHRARKKGNMGHRI